MRNLVGTITALAFAALAAIAGTASAGEAVKILVELPKNTTSVEAGDPGLDVQIVGVDATGARVGFGDRKVETSSNEGELILVEAPYKYRYVPPAAIEQATPVTLRAWLKQAPDVKGEASLSVVLRRPFERLALVAPATSLALGTSMEIEVRGVRADGTSAAIKGQKITMASEGVGTVEPTAATVFRFTAPAKTETKLIGATAHLRAQLDAYPKVAGELSIVLTAEAPPAAPGGTTPVPATEPKPPVTDPKAPAPQPAAPAPAAGAEKEEGVLWPSGNVKLLIWRSKHKKDDEFPKKDREDLPPAGKPLVARAPYHRLRVEVERDDVRKVELEWYVGEKKGAPIHVDDQDKDGRLRTEKNKAGKTCAILEFETPDEKPLILNLLLTTDKGEVLKEEFVVERGKDKNDDGSKDGKDKGKGGKKGK
jgi:hypothetical protein